MLRFDINEKIKFCGPYLVLLLSLF